MISGEIGPETVNVKKGGRPRFLVFFGIFCFSFRDKLVLALSFYFFLDERMDETFHLLDRLNPPLISSAFGALASCNHHAAAAW